MCSTDNVECQIFHLSARRWRGAWGLAAATSAAATAAPAGACRHCRSGSTWSRQQQRTDTQRDRGLPAPILAWQRCPHTHRKKSTPDVSGAMSVRRWGPNVNWSPRETAMLRLSQFQRSWPLLRCKDKSGYLLKSEYRRQVCVLYGRSGYCKWFSRLKFCRQVWVL